MSTGSTILATLTLTLTAAGTASIWANPLMILPCFVIGRVFPYPRRVGANFAATQCTMWLVTGGGVLCVGLFALGLVWYAALIAAVLDAATSYLAPKSGAEHGPPRGSTLKRT